MRFVAGFLVALLAFFQGGAGIFGSQEKDMNKRQEQLDLMNKRYDRDHALWAYVRSRLQVGAGMVPCFFLY